MAGAIISVLAEQLISIVKEQVENEIQLVRGVEKELNNLSAKLKKVINVLDDADTKQFKDKNVKDWLRRLEQTSYEMEDVLDEWIYAMLQHKIQSHESVPPSNQKVCSFFPNSCLCFKKVVERRDIAKKIQNLKSRLDEILKEEGEYKFVISQPKNDPSPASWRVQTTSLVDSAEVQGRSDDQDILVSKLTATHEGSGYQVHAIVGAGGLGKTTLAQLVYNDTRVQECFDLRIWLCVSDPFDVAAIAKGIIESINGRSSHDATQLDVLLKDVIDSISGKKILLVLDDVWNEQEVKWEPLKNALRCVGASSKIMVTTRKVKVAGIMGTLDENVHRPELLSDEECWLLMSLSALSGKKEREIKNFEKIGKEIAKKCNGLPLAAKTLGSLLGCKNTIEGWEKVLKSEMWELEHAEVELFPHLLLSYQELSPTLKHCFSYCAVRPKDEEIEVGRLIGIWMALGYLGSNIGSAKGNMELKGREFFEDLAMQSLFQDFEIDDDTQQIVSFKMHDIVHDFAQFLRKNERDETEKSCQVCNPLLVSCVKRYRTLFWKEETHSSICDCLTSVRAFVFIMDPNGIPRGMEKLIHLRWLNMNRTKLSKEDMQTLCKLYFLQTLLLERCSIEEIPREIGNLFQLRYLDLSGNGELKKLPQSLCCLTELQTLLLAKCSLQEIPEGIGNMVELRHLDLSENKELKKLPVSMCGLIELQILLLAKCSLEEIPRGIENLVHLRHLDLNKNKELNELPDSMCSLVQLQVLDIEGCTDLYQLPEGVGELSDIRTLKGFHGGSGRNKMGLLKKLNRLSGDVKLYIKVSSSDVEELVEDAREAELRNKEYIETLYLHFEDVDGRSSSSQSSSSLWVHDVIEALEPHHNLKQLQIWSYKGFRLPHWISSPLNLVKKIVIGECRELASLPQLGKLPLLEDLYVYEVEELEVVGAEWLGIRGEGGGDMKSSLSSSSSVVVFHKLKELKFRACGKWEEWGDITIEEEESAAVQIMPSLTKLYIHGCDRLKKLPHRLLRKPHSLQEMYLLHSYNLIKCYANGNGDQWRSISQFHPQLELRFRW